MTSRRSRGGPWLLHGPVGTKGPGRTLAACLIAASMAAGCTSSQNPPAPGLAQIQQPVTPDYRIGPLDTVQIFVWQSPEFSMTVPVRPDGRISTPLIEDLPATGKTPTQLARDIEEKLKV
jgi:polysaccharide export outer membrane protein